MAAKIASASNNKNEEMCETKHTREIKGRKKELLHCISWFSISLTGILTETIDEEKGNK